MAIDLVYQTPKTIEDVNKNISALGDVALHKQVVNVDTSGITKPISETPTQSEVEAIRQTLLTLINNLKAS